MKTLKIGRSRQCDIMVMGDDISRLHAEMRVQGGKYIYKDVSKNGTSIAGKYIHQAETILEPGVDVLLANNAPLPWAQVYNLLPLHQETGGTVVNDVSTTGEFVTQVEEKDKLKIGWAILSFIAPIIGIVLYFCWKEETPKRAMSALKIALIGWGVSFIIGFIVGVLS